jgi:hypothetical protein
MGTALPSLKFVEEVTRIREAAGRLQKEYQDLLLEELGILIPDIETIKDNGILSGVNRKTTKKATSTKVSENGKLVPTSVFQKKEQINLPSVKPTASDQSDAADHNTIREKEDSWKNLSDSDKKILYFFEQGKGEPTTAEILQRLGIDFSTGEGRRKRNTIEKRLSSLHKRRIIERVPGQHKGGKWRIRENHQLNLK